MERAIIIERVKSGLRRAVASGKHLGRPLVDCNIADVLRLKAEGCSVRQIADFLGISKSKVSRILTVPKSPLERAFSRAEFSGENSNLD